VQVKGERNMLSTAPLAARYAPACRSTSRRGGHRRAMDRMPAVTASSSNSQPCTDAEPPASLPVRRRTAIGLASASLALSLVATDAQSVAAAQRKESLGLETEWATESFARGTDFSLESYASMRDDAERTPKFVEAIRRRIGREGGRLSCVDIGTGPFALLAIAAAKAGARKVFAIEADPEAAKLARAAIRDAGLPPGTVELLEGYSTAVELPEKVDFLVAEVIGSVATEEGVYSTISDARQRFLKDPSNPANYIPSRVQTLVAPASYAFHYMIAAEGRRAAGLTSEEGPLRLNCLDQSLALMADPQVYEDFRYDDPELPGPGLWRPKADALEFRVSPERISRNTRMYVETLGFQGVPPADAKAISAGVACGFSGLALWPRLILDPAGDIMVDARGVRGEGQKSHWQTVLPLMSKSPVPLSIGDEITVSGSATFDNDKPTVYRLHADISHYSAA